MRSNLPSIPFQPTSSVSPLLLKVSASSCTVPTLCMWSPSFTWTDCSICWKVLWSTTIASTGSFECMKGVHELHNPGGQVQRRPVLQERLLCKGWRAPDLGTQRIGDEVLHRHQIHLLRFGRGVWHVHRKAQRLCGQSAGAGLLIWVCFYINRKLHQCSSELFSLASNSSKSASPTPTTPTTTSSSPIPRSPPPKSSKMAVSSELYLHAWRRWELCPLHTPPRILPM